MEKYPQLSRFVEGDVSAVFTAVRDAIHKGARLVSHPLSGSIKPNVSPYKSIAVETIGGSLHYDSLRAIEDAIAALKRLGVKNRFFTEEVLEDFRVIDLDIISNVL